MTNETMTERLASFQGLLDVQCSDGNWDFDPYMFGMANGMILAAAMMRGEDPKYLDAPKEWGSDKGVSLPLDPSECIETPLI